jgi:hypothetical protein
MERDMDGGQEARRRGVPQRAATADGHTAVEPGRGLGHCRWCFLRAQRL